jgi:hypothetical protein
MFLIIIKEKTQPTALKGTVKSYGSPAHSPPPGNDQVASRY